MLALVVGLGEVGGALYRVLYEKYGIENIEGYDIKEGTFKTQHYDFLHICLPYSDKFKALVTFYIKTVTPKYTIIHSSVPIGTTEQFGTNVFHSPVRGQHPKMYQGLKTYTKFLGYNTGEHEKIDEVEKHLEDAGMEVKAVFETKATELMKLLALSRYGVYIAFAKEQEKICEEFGLNYSQVVTAFEETRSEGLKKIGQDNITQPILYPFKKYVGGHCTVEDMELLLTQCTAPLLKQAYDIDRNTIIWENCNVYKTAKVGKGCSIGQFTEIGNNVVIGNDVRIGAYCFIPEGITIEDGVFIAPKVSFSNDKYPPSERTKWGKTIVKKNAVVGMGAIILPGVTIGEHAMIGAGSIVTKNVPKGEIWYGNPAYKHSMKEIIEKEKKVWEA